MPRPAKKARPTKTNAKKPLSAKRGGPASSARPAKTARKQSGSIARSKPSSRGNASKARGNAPAKTRTRTTKKTRPSGTRRTKANPDILTARNLVLNLDPLPAPPARVTAIRAKLRLSQAVFAQLMGVSVFALRSWEQGARDPSFMARRLLDEMEAHPAHWFDLLQKARNRK